MLSRKLLVTTASKTLKTIPFEEFAADMARRKAAAGPVDVPRNSGKNRTESKRALLKALEQTGARW